MKRASKRRRTQKRPPAAPQTSDVGTETTKYSEGWDELNNLDWWFEKKIGGKTDEEMEEHLRRRQTGTSPLLRQLNQPPLNQASPDSSTALLTVALPTTPLPVSAVADFTTTTTMAPSARPPSSVVTTWYKSGEEVSPPATTCDHLQATTSSTNATGATETLGVGNEEEKKSLMKQYRRVQGRMTSDYDGLDTDAEVVSLHSEDQPVGADGKKQEPEKQVEQGAAANIDSLLAEAEAEATTLQTEDMETQQTVPSQSAPPSPDTAGIAVNVGNVSFQASSVQVGGLQPPGSMSLPYPVPTVNKWAYLEKILGSLSGISFSLFLANTRDTLEAMLYPKVDRLEDVLKETQWLVEDKMMIRGLIKYVLGLTGENYQSYLAAVTVLKRYQRRPPMKAAGFQQQFEVDHAGELIRMMTTPVDRTTNNQVVYRYTTGANQGHPMIQSITKADRLIQIKILLPNINLSDLPPFDFEALFGNGEIQSTLWNMGKIKVNGLLEVFIASPRGFNVASDRMIVEKIWRQHMERGIVAALGTSRNIIIWTDPHISLGGLQRAAGTLDGGFYHEHLQTSTPTGYHINPTTTSASVITAECPINNNDVQQCRAFVTGSFPHRYRFLLDEQIQARTVNASLAMEDQLVFRSLGLQCLSLTINEVASLCVVVDHELTKLNLLRIASFFGWGELVTNEEIYQQCRVPPPPEILRRVFPQQGHHCPHEYFHREDSTPTDSMGTGGDSGNE